MTSLIRIISSSAAVAVALLAPAVGHAGSAPALSWLPTTSAGVYDYGTVAAATDATFTLMNSGGTATGALTVTLSPAASSSFAKTVDNCTATSLGPNKSCVIAVRYSGSDASDSVTLAAAAKKLSASASITLKAKGDSTPPDTAIDSNPPNPTSSSSASFSFSGSDSGSGVTGFECNLDDGGFTACTSPQSYLGLAVENHTFQVRAVDGAGNVDPTPAFFAWTITINAGEHTSVALDAMGRPVVSYWDRTNGDLRVLHCFFQFPGLPCEVVSNVAPDTAGNVGEYTSLVLDAAGNPVVSYYDRTNGDLKLLHCGDPDCLAGNVITSPDTEGNVGWYTSLVLDAKGNAVVSYYDATKGDLKVLHCWDEQCGDRTITSPDPATAANVGWYTSLELDTAGNPVISYYDLTAANLKLLSCLDPSCRMGSVITSPDTNGSVGAFTSIALDADGDPVVSYHDASNGDLKVLHCGDRYCSTGVIRSPDTIGIVGRYTSLALDTDDKPVVSYYDVTNGDMKVLYCADEDCAQSVSTTPDMAGNVGWYTSLALDAAGNPVVSYYDVSNFHLKVGHYVNPFAT